MRSTRWRLWALCSLFMLLSTHARPQTTSVDLGQGIHQVEEGDLDAAIITLDGVVRQLSGVPGRQGDLALAHLYLGTAYLGVGQTERARTQFKEAWRNNKEMTLDPKKFPPRVLRAYEEAKGPAAPSADQSPPGKPKGGSKSKGLLIAGGLAAIGGGVALAGSSSSASTAATPAPGPQVLASGGSSISGPNITTRFTAFTIRAAGVVQYTGDWTFPTSSFSLHLGQNCGGFAPYAAETSASSTKPVTLRHPVSAGEVYCPYAFYVSGVGSESFSYQIVFTPQ